MKFFIYIFRGIVTLTALCLFAQGAFAYAPESTHAGLTQEIIYFYEAKSGGVLSDDESQLLIQASIDEDDPSSRSLSHFYDPVHGVGFNDNRSSLDWATNELSGNAFTWQKGIAAYARGDERTAMLALGHVLHLLEDASVPDHTRNDPHKGDGLGGLYTGESPFEYWTNLNKDRETLRGTGKQFVDAGLEMHDCSSITRCFNFMALYSNGNFFSRDTIGSVEYPNPKMLSDDGVYVYGNDELLGVPAKLYMYQKVGNKMTFSLTDGVDFSVISEYFDRLAPQVVGVGARVIDLYMNEAKFARAEHLRTEAEARSAAVARELALAARMKDAGTWKQFVFGFTDIFFTRPLLALSNTGTRVALATNGLAQGYTIAFGNVAYGTQMVTMSGARASIAIAEKTEELASTAITKTNETVERTRTDLTHLITQLLAARVVLQRIALAEASQIASAESGEVLGASTTPLIAAVSASTVVPTPPTPAVAVRIDYGVPQGSAPDPHVGAGPVSPPVVILPPPPVLDTTAPDAPVVLSFQGSLFVQGGILGISTTSVVFDGTGEASSTVTLLAIDDATTTAHFFDVGVDAHWNFALMLSEGTTTLILTATDEAGNVSSSTELTLLVTLPPPPPPAPPTASDIRITEVAWSGTVASSGDEWLEIQNRTDGPLSLDGLVLQTLDGGLVIPLSGTILAHQYYVIASAAEVFSNYTANAVAAFGDGLLDAGEEIQLVRSADSVVLDKIPYCLDWCGRGNVAGATMMIGFWDEGLIFDWNNWFIVGQFTWVRDRAGHYIIGMPGVGTENLMAI